MADGINLRLGRRDMNVFRTIDRAGERPVVHVAGRYPAALCPSCAHPSVDTNGTGWRDVIDVVRTLVITLSVCVRRFVCTNEACSQRTFDERFEGIGRGGASERALGFFADSCLGAALARAELRIALSTLLRRLPDIDLDRTDPPVRNKILTINGYVRVPVRWDPSAAQPATTA